MVYVAEVVILKLHTHRNSAQNWAKFDYNITKFKID
jgi:hypothetical protein